MPSEVILEYKRVKGDLSTGRILWYDQLASQYVENEFEDIEFRPMLILFAKALAKYPTALGTFQRTDRPGLVPYNLDVKVVDLFRTDPVAAIESMCPNPSPSTTIQRTREERKPQFIRMSVRSGFDVLADAFGDELFSPLRVKGCDPYAECPCCGIWCNVLLGSISCRNPSCVLSDNRLLLKRVNKKWVSFRTDDVLATKSNRYYLPRAWNDGRPWVSWEDLNKKYEEYKKEKTSCTEPDLA